MPDMIGQQDQPGLKAVTGLHSECCICRKHGGSTFCILACKRVWMGTQSSLITYYLINTTEDFTMFASACH